MPVRVTLAGGERSSTAEARLTVITPARRALRAALVMVVGLAGAAALIPVPIVHLIGIPLMVIVTVVLVVRQVRMRAQLSRVHLPCPRCGASQGFGGAAGLRSIDRPMDVTCDSCRRGLQLTVAPFS